MPRLDREARRAAIEAAFEALGPGLHKADEVALAAEVLSLMTASPAAGQSAAAADDTVPNAHRDVGGRSTLAEIEALAGVLERAAAGALRRVARLHKPAIVALADEHILRAAIERWAAQAKTAAAEIRRAKRHVGPRRAARGRPSKRRQVAVGRVIIDAYARIFGRRADLPAEARGQPEKAGGQPGLLALATAIFAILELRGSPKAAIDAAIEELAAAAGKPGPNEGGG